MAGIEQVSKNLWMNSSELFTYHSGIFVSDGKAVVIDPGLGVKEIQAITQFVNQQKWDVQAVVLTHGHWDHVLGAEAFPNARIIAQREYLTSKRNDPIVIQRIIEKTPDLGRTSPFSMPVPHETFDEMMVLSVGKLELELTHTPGHAPDHFFVYERESGTVWTADMLSNEEIPYVIDNLAVFERTLENIRADDFRLLIPCHGTATDDVNEIRARIENDRKYLSELRGRVKRAVEQGKTLGETKALCADIPYRQSAEENHPAHERNVETAYVELGGPVDPDSVGWQRAWIDFTA